MRFNSLHHVNHYVSNRVLFGGFFVDFGCWKSLLNAGGWQVKWQRLRQNELSLLMVAGCPYSVGLAPLYS
ncbi:hypothetical protein MPTK1_6g15830 [Marchantia polymorpha subsp. ruderalis]|uniref:Uncharacterized protein n=2 Tax=Marchantia polymorpha TaxID=3197 RepID=A0AAF6BSH7_MARPO|nr:hypothetical protein MARPO_0056s0095 [Marchantia polymorpha]BBN14961.1 hypothetical protein Mp_6g15830 [Marchantia polymorpha subsp. ruderalis]|eukprot:PTQ37645.1 hypothetical protein MARPO_0056s0095 [Marchantia polymorpha]